jgi:hypothetical protein
MTPDQTKPQTGPLLHQAVAGRGTGMGQQSRISIQFSFYRDCCCSFPDKPRLQRSCSDHSHALIEHTHACIILPTSKSKQTNKTKQNRPNTALGSLMQKWQTPSSETPTSHPRPKCKKKTTNDIVVRCTESWGLIDNRRIESSVVCWLGSF